MNKVNYKYERITFLSAIIAGLFAHTYVFVHNFQIHDNVYNFYLGGTITSGRWMLFLCNSFMNKINGNFYHYHSSWYLGVISLVLTAVAAAFVSNLLRFKNKLSAIATGAIMVCFPSMASMYAFMYTAALYSFGFFLVVVGAWLISTQKKWYLWALGIVSIGSGIGIYQAYISIFLALFLMHFFVEVYDEKEKKTPKLITLRAVFYVIATACSMGFYFAALKLCLWHYHTALSDYRGLSEGTSGIGVYFSRLAKAYCFFFMPLSTGTDNMYRNTLLYAYWAVLVLSVLAVIFLAIRKFLKRKFDAVVILLCTLFLPLAFNFVYVMVPDDVYSLMMYGETLFFVWLVLISEYLEFELRDLKQIPVKRIVTYCLPAFVLFFSFMYARTDNICYTKADEIQTAANSYFTRMVGRIENVRGYTESTPVLFVNYEHEADKTLFKFTEYDAETQIFPYNLETLTTDYNWMNLMTMTTGWRPVEADAEALTNDLWTKVDKMPGYPDDGSVAMVEGIVVVKLKEKEANIVELPEQ